MTSTADTLVKIADVRWRERARVRGRVRSLRVQPWSGAPTIECVVVDETGGLIAVFLGRRWIPGIRPGSVLVVEGMVGEHDGRPAIINPDYEIVANGDVPSSATARVPLRGASPRSGWAGRRRSRSGPPRRRAAR